MVMGEKDFVASTTQTTSDDDAQTDFDGFFEGIFDQISNHEICV